MQVISDAQRYKDVLTALGYAQHLFRASRYPQDVASYLEARPGALADTTDVAGLGYAPSGYSSTLQGWGATLAALRDTGLVDSRGQETFADRITFPWLSTSGSKILGMGGRTWRPGDGRPKYENSPETNWFAKGRVLFGLAQASRAIHGSGWALVVEGPFDCLRLWAMGYTNTVSPVGAKVTLDQLLGIARFAEDVVLLLDNDEGGRRGVESAIGLLRSDLVPTGLRLHQARLTASNDPGSATERELAEALASIVPLAHK